MGFDRVPKNIPRRSAPRERSCDEAKGRLPKVAALVLAAGTSSRMGLTNKLLSEVDGTPMVARAVSTARSSQAESVIVVTGHDADAVRSVLRESDVQFVHNADYPRGLSTSLSQGLRALPADTDGVLICLGDMPRVTAQILNRLIEAFDPDRGRAICVPTHDGRRGNPVLLGCQFIPEILGITGDVGARHLVKRHSKLLCEVEVNDAAILMDIDSPEALAVLSK